MIVRRLQFCSLFFISGGGFDLNVKLKKVLCFALTALLLSFYTLSCCVYASGVYPTPTPVGGMPWWDDKDWETLKQIDATEPASLEFTKILATIMTGSEVANKELGQGVANVLGTLLHDLANNGNIRKDDNNYYINAEGINQINQAVQDKVHALDGYYLIEPTCSFSFDSFYKNLPLENDSYYESDKSRESVINYYMGEYKYALQFSTDYVVKPFNPSYMYIKNGNVYFLHSSGEYSNSYNGFRYTSDRGFLPSNGGFTSFYMFTDLSVYLGKDGAYSIIYGDSPFKIFYSKEDLDKYINNGEQRTYAPKLPNVTIKIPVKYINNSVSLPDITYNITTENKTETEIQNQYDITIKNYLDSLDNFTDGTDPTPTPTPSGGFTDGTTPTPTPAIGDGGSDQDGNGSDGWLKKIYDQLVKLSDSVSQHFEKEETFEDKLSKYLESHDKKLDEIVDAIDKLSQGKEEGEEKGCKYDYTELSDFLTKLWNDSDQKFDQMVELLKENNEYQEKMLSTLNSIKNILKAQTVMDTFKNRSSETANKAKEKFPTSVPWDVGLLVNAMDAEPKAPVFELPIKIERLNIDEKITVDISSGEWEKLAKACRYMLSLLFVLFMVNLTRKLFFSKGDD